MIKLTGSLIKYKVPIASASMVLLHLDMHSFFRVVKKQYMLIDLPDFIIYMCILTGSHYAVKRNRFFGIYFAM